jgi:zinc protease
MQHSAGWLLLATCIATVPLQGQEPAKIEVESFTLENGLKVLLAPEPNSQVVAVNIDYRVGSRDERLGRTGFAHLFEHMMFKGSKHLGDGEHMRLVSRAGGDVNAQTTEDRTIYWQVLPSNQLQLGLWLEAERMRSLDVTEEKFANQRAAVKEEVRLKVDNPAYARAVNDGLAAIADPQACFGYAHSGFGSMADLDSASVADVKAFFARYYVPNNATLAVVGDFNPAEAKRLVRQYFGDIARGSEPQRTSCKAAFNPGQVRRRVQDRNAALPLVGHFYRIPGVAHADYPALDLLVQILGQGESSQLNRSLVRERKAAAAAFALVNPPWPRQDLTSFMVAAIANQGVPVDSVDALLAREVARLAAGGLTAAELQKAQNTYRANLITQRQQARTRAEEIQAANFYFGSPEAVNTSLQRYMGVTVDDLKRVASTYLRPENSLALIVSSEVVK